ncbi:uncharacterized protein LOC126320456 [Schistocerca gregaria]|uniref:uncharacterized protein LOC126320456 n=1 Tax=Schistocerca gregaria TaxID=7010 RepID=UPI00211E61BD|nr:uncharacterized protein LOC126320456 [Schistocerca gregaria]
MRNIYNYDVYLKKLCYIHSQCVSACKKEEEALADNIDEFTRFRKEIAVDIRETRKSIEKYHSSKPASSNAEFVKEGAVIRNHLKELRGKVEKLSDAQKAHEKELAKNNTPDLEKKIELEKDVVATAWKHLEQLETMERYGNNMEQIELFKDEEQEIALAGEIPDLDDPQFTALRETDAEINKGLDDISEALKIVKELAQNIGIELEAQNELITDVDQDIDQIQEKVLTVNASMKRTLKKLRGPKECCCNMFVICLILGIAACVIFILL